VELSAHHDLTGEDAKQRAGYRGLKPMKTALLKQKGARI